MFGIHLHKKDKALLQAIQNLFQGIGNITDKGKNAVQFQVSSYKDLEILISHFDKYSLITQKLADYELFKQAFNLISCKEHLTKDGFDKLVAIKSSINKGLPDKLRQAFPNIEPISRPLVENKKVINPNWLAGFIDAEGCFFVQIEKSPSKLGEKVRLKFKISQHIRDRALLESFIEYFDCGSYYTFSRKNVGDFVIYKFSDINSKIIPFIEKYPIYGVKSLDYIDFCNIAELIKNKAHLTTSGLEQINKIKARMNRNRIFENPE